MDAVKLACEFCDTQEGRGHRGIISRTDQIPEVLDDMIRDMEGAGYGPADLFAARLAVGEAVSNAVKHGHRHDPGKQVRLWWVVTALKLRVLLIDEGPGFDPASVPDPRRPENQGRPSGRGLLLIRHYMSSVHYNRQGNCLAMCRHRSETVR